ncbi:MAG TPA: alpha/beta hydrolase-fold protein [Chloroflexota bacterium]
MPRNASVGRAVLLGLVLALLCAFASSAHASPSEAPASFDAPSVYLYVPAGLQGQATPAQVVFALHGMGGEGKGFSQALIGAAEQNGWVLVAPTFRYRNWRDPATVAEDDLALTHDLVALLDTLPGRIGRPVERRAIVLGFSRGAQLAHRFALTYPERTRAVAAMSAGSYTVPSPLDPSQGADRPLLFPFGTADLAWRSGHPIDADALDRIPFWIGVGGDDTTAADVPRQWDTLLGKTRLERARSFVSYLKAAGAPASLAVFPHSGHAMTPEMVSAAVAFLRQETAAPGKPAAEAPALTRLAGLFAL